MRTAGNENIEMAIIIEISPGCTIRGHPSDIWQYITRFGKCAVTVVDIKDNAVGVERQKIIIFVIVVIPERREARCLRDLFTSGEGMVTVVPVKSAIVLIQVR